MAKEFVRIFFAFLKLCPAFYYYYVPVLAAPCLKSTTTRRFATFNLHTHQLNKKNKQIFYRRIWLAAMFHARENKFVWGRER